MFLSERTVWPYRYRYGSSPLVVSMPHVGTFVPASIARSLNECAARRPDTDWHLPRLYDFLEDLDATVITASFSRYVVDVNRPPDGANLYPGRDTPRLCPTDTFGRELLYRDGEPSGEEIGRRVAATWQPYHGRLAMEVERVKALHGVAMLWDAHSITAEQPRLFEGRLPDFNLGTGGGTSCDPALAQSLRVALQRHAQYTSVLDGRFQGGYITRHFGDPASNVHAVQLEMVEDIYMDEEPPFAFRPERAARVRPILREQLEIALDFAVNRSASRRVEASGRSR
jgi:N-formylglutamate deformylase